MHLQFMLLHGFSLHKVYKFMKQINSSFGSGGMALAMSEVEFATFIIYLTSHPQMPIRKAASVIGQQQCGKVWVMGKHLQVGFASSLTVIFKCTKVEVPLIV